MGAPVKVRPHLAGALGLVTHLGQRERNSQG
jgi:hypothetical protein